MTQVYPTLRVAPSDKGVLGVVIDAPPMNLIGPQLVRDLVGLLGALESDQETTVVVLESADPDYFVPHVDLTKVVPLPNAEFLDQRLPTSRLVIIDAGHFVWEEAPAKYASTVLDSITGNWP